MEWQPIDTAPKDGTELLVYCDVRYPEYYHAQYSYGIWRLVHVGDYASGSELEDEPTHWMPLPPAPTEASRGEEKA